MAMVDLHAELWGAMKLAELARSRLPDDRLVQSLPTKGVPWGLGVVEYYGAERELYEPQPKGRPAVIVPVIEDGDTIDLAAVDMFNGHLARRYGYSVALGADAIERARWGGCNLHLVPRPLDWVRRQPEAWANARRFMRAVHNRMQNPKDQTGDESLPDDFAYLFDIRRAPRLLDDVSKLIAVGEAFYDRVRALIPPSARDRLLCLP
jgi:transposase InsO family protein